MRRIYRRTRRVAQVIALGARLARVAPGPRAKARIFYVTVLLGARRILKKPGQRWHELRIRVGTTEPTVVVSDYGELEVMRDILLDEEYGVEEIPTPRVILDVGANIGLAALYFRARFPDAEIVAVEPDPQTFAKLEQNVGGDARIRAVNAAAAAERGELELFQPAGYSIASSLKRSGDAEHDSHVRVRAETLDGLCTELGLERIGLMKLDVEGAELEALRGFARRDAVSVILGEAHPQLLGDQLDEFFSLLSGFEVRRLSESRDAISFLATAAD